MPLALLVAAAAAAAQACRICECTPVEIARMAEHSKLCMTDVVVFHVEHSLQKLRRHISSEIKRRDQALNSALALS
jgi:hypothetical protein